MGNATREENFTTTRLGQTHFGGTENFFRSHCASLESPLRPKVRSNPLSPSQQVESTQRISQRTFSPCSIPPSLVPCILSLYNFACPSSRPLPFWTSSASSALLTFEFFSACDEFSRTAKDGWVIGSNTPPNSIHISYFCYLCVLCVLCGKTFWWWLRYAVVKVFLLVR